MLLPILLPGLLAPAQQRLAAVHEVQPSSRDAVHAVWPHGPTFSEKLPSGAAAPWPTFAEGVASRSGARCSTRDERYTGYDEDGSYCEAASTALDTNAHLLLYSGRLGLVVDAGGLTAAADSGLRNLVPKVGALGGEMAARQAYDTLPAASTSITLDTTCPSGTTTYVLGTSGGSFVQTGLVRQGHTVTQVSLTGLEFQSTASGGVYGPCESFVPVRQNDDDFASAAGRRLTHATSHHWQDMRACIEQQNSRRE